MCLRVFASLRFFSMMNAETQRRGDAERGTIFYYIVYLLAYDIRACHQYMAPFFLYDLMVVLLRRPFFTHS